MSAPEMVDHVTPEWVTAIATAFTGLVIFVTIIFAARQVKVLTEQSKAMAAQLEQLRRSTQLEGAMAIFAELRGPRFREARHFVLNELPDRLKDESFRESLVKRAVDEEKHKERYLQVAFEEIGTYVKNGLLDSETILDFYAGVIVESWERLTEVVELQRRAWGYRSYWENFEYLADAANKFIDVRFSAKKL